MTFRETPLHNAFLLGAKKEFARLIHKTQGGSNHSNSSSSNQPAGMSASSSGGGASSGPRSWSHQMTLASLSSAHHPHQSPASASRDDSKVDINVRDAQGRSALHLVASSLDPNALEFLRMLLESLPKSNLQVNAQDLESGWTALHRALYVGNLAGARMLLAEERIDPRIKDGEGLTCFDLYNSTVEGTNPPESADTGDALFTWGANRNYVLGHGSGDDRSLPDRVQLKRAEKKAWQQPSVKHLEDDEEADLEEDDEEGAQLNDLRLTESPGVREVVMSKLHTGVITTERSNNINLCGFGSGGRLGRATHSQSDLAPMPDFSHSIISLALGQDHTLALTSNGDVLSWGLNRFSVLGYTIDAPAEGTQANKFKNTPDEPIQMTPRRIVGPLKKEVVQGVAASRCSSACWTEDAVWTWGENHGHLGYDVGSNPIQVLPRKVAGVSQPVIGLAVTDYALACLLDSYEVLVFHRGTNFKIAFPVQPFFADSAIYRPPGFLKRLQVTKITSSGISFACLSSMGDVYTFALANPVEMEREANTAGNGGKGSHVRPSRVWSLRKRFTAVQDVALGSDGAIILCTASGHVYVRTRNTKSNNPSFSSASSKAFKFQRIPYLQRIIKVAANESGAFAAIRSDASPKSIAPDGNKLGEDFVRLQPHVRRWMEDRSGSYLLEEGEERILIQQNEDDEAGAGADIEPAAIRLDIKIATQLFVITQEWKPASSYPPLFGLAGSDMVFHVAGRDTPVHQIIVGARSSVLRKLLSREKLSATTVAGRGVSLERTAEGLVRVHLPKCEHFTLLLLVHYIYADDIPSVWDTRIGSHVQGLSPTKKLDLVSVRRELAHLAEVLDIQALIPVLSLLTKRIPLPTLATDLARAFAVTQQLTSDLSVNDTPSTSPLRPDVILELQDARVGAHQAILRSRSPFFSALFEDPDWTRSRREADSGLLIVNLQHLKPSVMRPVFRFIYEDATAGVLFDYFHQSTIDQFLDFTLEVLATANELLLDKLVLICSSVILRHVTIHNVTGLLSDASFYHARALKESLQLYIAQNLETMLESRLLETMDLDILTELSTFIASRQGLRLPISRSGLLIQAAMDRQSGWLAMQDIPTPTLRSGRTFNTTRPPPLPRSPTVDSSLDSTASPKPVQRRTSTTVVCARASPAPSPAVKAQSPASRREPSGGDDDDGMFAMDEEDADVSSLVAGVRASLSIGPNGGSSSSDQGATGRGPSSSGVSLASGSKPVWKSRAVGAEKTDLRSILAAEAASSSTLAPRPLPAAGPSRPSLGQLPEATSSTNLKLSQKDRKKLQASTSAAAAAAAAAVVASPGAASGSSSTPWRLPTPAGTPSRPSPPPFSSASSASSRTPPPPSLSRVPSSLAMQSPKPNPLPRLGSSGSTTGARATPSSLLSPPLARASPANASGEVIVPVRQSSFNSTPRKPSDPAWSTPSFASPPSSFLHHASSSFSSTPSLPPPSATPTPSFATSSPFGSSTLLASAPSFVPSAYQSGSQPPSSAPPLRTTPSSTAIYSTSPIPSSFYPSQLPSSSSSSTAGPPPPSPPPALPALTSTKSSFLAIQLQQSDDKASAAPKPIQTLKQIQEDERRVQEAAKEEREFMIWWEAEEKRIAAAAALGGGGGGNGGGGRGGKKSGRGGGKKGGGGKSGVASGGGSSTSGQPLVATTDGTAPSPSRGGGGNRGGRGGGRGGGNTPRESGGGGRGGGGASGSHTPNGKQPPRVVG